MFVDCVEKFLMLQLVFIVFKEESVFIASRLDSADKSRPFTPRDITTLRVKSEAGDHTYILKMKFHETVGDLRKYISIQR